MCSIYHDSLTKSNIMSQRLPMTPASLTTLVDITTESQPCLIGQRAREAFKHHLTRCNDRGLYTWEALKRWRIRNGFHTAPNRACCEMLEAMGQKRHTISANLLDILTTQLQVEIQKRLVEPHVPIKPLDDDIDIYSLEEKLSSVVHQACAVLECPLLRPCATNFILGYFRAFQRRLSTRSQNLCFPKNESLGTCRQINKQLITEEPCHLLRASVTLVKKNYHVSSDGTVFHAYNFDGPFSSSLTAALKTVVHLANSNTDVYQYCTTEAPIAFRSLLWPFVPDWLTSELIHLIPGALHRLHLREAPSQLLLSTGRSNNPSSNLNLSPHAPTNVLVSHLLPKVSAPEELLKLTEAASMSPLSFGMFCSLVETAYITSFSPNIPSDVFPPELSSAIEANEELSAFLMYFTDRRQQKQNEPECRLPSLRVEVLAELAKENPGKATDLDPLALQLMGLMELLSNAVSARRSQDVRVLETSTSSTTLPQLSNAQTLATRVSSFASVTVPQKPSGTASRDVDAVLNTLKALTVTSLEDLGTVSFILLHPPYLLLLAELLIDLQLFRSETDIITGSSLVQKSAEFVLSLLVVALSFPIIYSSIHYIRRSVQTQQQSQNSSNVAPSTKSSTDDTDKLLQSNYAKKRLRPQRDSASHSLVSQFPSTSDLGILSAHADNPNNNFLSFLQPTKRRRWSVSSESQCDTDTSFRDDDTTSSIGSSSRPEYTKTLNNQSNVGASTSPAPSNISVSTLLSQRSSTKPQSALNLGSVVQQIRVLTSSPYLSGSGAAPTNAILVTNNNPVGCSNSAMTEPLGAGYHLNSSNSIAPATGTTHSSLSSSTGNSLRSQASSAPLFASSLSKDIRKCMVHLRPVTVRFIKFLYRALGTHVAEAPIRSSQRQAQVADRNRILLRLAEVYRSSLSNRPTNNTGGTTTQSVVLAPLPIVTCGTSTEPSTSTSTDPINTPMEFVKLKDEGTSGVQDADLKGLFNTKPPWLRGHNTFNLQPQSVTNSAIEQPRRRYSLDRRLLLVILCGVLRCGFAIPGMRVLIDFVTRCVCDYTAPLMLVEDTTQILTSITPNLETVDASTITRFVRLLFRQIIFPSYDEAALEMLLQQDNVEKGIITRETWSYFYRLHCVTLVTPLASSLNLSLIDTRDREQLKSGQRFAQEMLKRSSAFGSFVWRDVHKEIFNILKDSEVNSKEHLQN